MITRTIQKDDSTDGHSKGDEGHQDVGGGSSQSDNEDGQTSGHGLSEQGAGEDRDKDDTGTKPFSSVMNCGGLSEELLIAQQVPKVLTNSKDRWAHPQLVQSAEGQRTKPPPPHHHHTLPPSPLLTNSNATTLGRMTLATTSAKRTLKMAMVPRSANALSKVRSLARFLCPNQKAARAVGVVRVVGVVGVVGAVEAVRVVGAVGVVEVEGVLRKRRNKALSLQQVKKGVTAQGTPESPVSFAKSLSPASHHSPLP